LTVQLGRQPRTSPVAAGPGRSRLGLPSKRLSGTRRGDFCVFRARNCV
jgi:hypothetical protein